MILEIIRNTKNERGWTNQRLSDESGVPIGTINRILAGRTEDPYYSNIVRLCRALTISIDAVEGIEPNVSIQGAETRNLQGADNACNTIIKSDGSQRLFTSLFADMRKK